MAETGKEYAAPRQRRRREQAWTVSGSTFETTVPHTVRYLEPWQHCPGDEENLRINRMA
jgi:hypothetical protein